MIFELIWNERILNEELKNINNIQKEFIITAAHELRNPIHIILGSSSILSSIGDDHIKNYKEVVNAIDRNAETQTTY